MAATGNVRECEGSQNSIEIEDLARFAVEEHNKKQGDYVEFFLGLEVHFKYIWLASKLQPETRAHKPHGSYKVSD
ncbi:cysteine proteinase inhibitor-like isoform X3 [Primulina eburnea]|uniref:cysteine proteinase inhibitor-like isoform X3 n=1 Tax=Primulina eburnea TaxID=1245227 RepID=UPI003C6C793A